MAHAARRQRADGTLTFPNSQSHVHHGHLAHHRASLPSARLRRVGDGQMSSPLEATTPVHVMHLITAHGYGIVLAVAFVDQFGAPIPSIAVLLAAGAVAG